MLIVNEPDLGGGTTFVGVVSVEEIVCIDFEDLFLMTIDGFEFVSIYYFGDEQDVVLLHFLEVLAGYIA